MKYKVIKEILEGWETGAKVNDILHVSKWEGDLVLSLKGKAVCDIDSTVAKENCIKIEER